MTSRTDRRRERTREALIAAAQRILAEQGSENVPIQAITEEADVGSGTFYNYFTTKDELFDAAVTAAIADHENRLDEALQGIKDPLDIFITSWRLTALLAATQPAMARLFVHSGLRRLTADTGLAPRALADLRRALDAGEIARRDPHLALTVTAGCLFSYMQMRTHEPPLITDADADQLAEDLLVMLGANRRKARRLSHRPLPDP